MPVGNFSQTELALYLIITTHPPNPTQDSRVELVMAIRWLVDKLGVSEWAGVGFRLAFGSLSDRMGGQIE